MRLNRKRYEILRALELQKRTGRPSLTVRNTPREDWRALCNVEPLNKNQQAKKKPMDEAQKMEVFKRTGFFPFVEVLYT
jgi:hypothetical protein